MTKKQGVSAVKLTAIILSAVMLVCSIIGGSLAWLMTSTEPIVNVFTSGDIEIDLDETTGERYKMTPGKIVQKDPAVTVYAESEDCWLFVKIEESTDVKLSDYIDYKVADGWTPLSLEPGVYYREVDYSDKDVTFNVLKDDQVTIKSTVNKEMMENLTDANYPKLTFTAYAIQRDDDIPEVKDATQAWLRASGRI